MGAEPGFERTPRAHGSPHPDGHPLDAVFRPRSVVVVGASADPRKRGHQVIPALREGGYPGTVHLVNPRGGEILGLPVRRSVEDLPEVPDLALVCTPAATVPEVVEACAGRGIRGAVVLAIGFREAGAAGAALEERVRAVARRAGIRVVGPNTSGILNVGLGLNLIGARDVPPGPLALLVQSGNVALQLMLEARRSFTGPAARSARGISFCIGVGNETDVSFHECLEFLGADRDTRAVLVYAEGFREPRAFLETAARLTRNLPVVVLRGGRTRAGSVAARSHTGAIAPESEALRAGLCQAGVVEVSRTDELFATGATLASQPPAPAGKGVAVLSDGGGHGALACDALTEAGVPLADLTPEARKTLRALLGSASAVGNPVDVGGPADTNPETFARALEVMAGDPGTGAVLVIGLFGGYHLRFASDLQEAEERAALGMADAAAARRIPLVVHSMYADARSRPLMLLEGRGVPVCGSLEVACRAMAAAVERGRRAARCPWSAGGEAGVAAAPRTPDGRKARPLVPSGVSAALARARDEGREALAEDEAREALAAFGLALVPATLCATPEEVAAAAARAKGPVAMKALHSEVLHKTEAGGVALGIRGGTQAREAYVSLRARVLAWLEERGRPDPAAGFRGVLVSPHLPPPLAEILVGARRDPGLGPLVAVASGGTAVELLGDAVLRLLPIEREEVREMLGELRTAPLLRGHRGRPPADLEVLADAVLAVSRLLLSCPEVAAAEANPVFAYPDRAVAVDARVLLSPPERG